MEKIRIQDTYPGFATLHFTGENRLKQCCGIETIFPVPVPTFKKFQFRFRIRFRIRSRLRIRFWIQTVIKHSFSNKKCCTKSCLFTISRLEALLSGWYSSNFLTIVISFNVGSGTHSGSAKSKKFRSLRVLNPVPA
jgi:hypothetical protein